ncbi:drug/metabolite transporter (DMT)-like permease [Bradyrhizobium sp. USDA 4524]|uniref:Permease of the drug/metabolite transporter (DMT) superfamily n=2 Tax=Bradyrhizobium TaxID=374 RepID=A0A1G6SNX4_9BRAD|nr:drug/metabolite transporter (DMT)-like permease [Bradyrhizobium sp. USDA 4538]MCP1851292.1 drug/metabolite transporter (DMT)-like permease [Bradyrhizobium sp. USDA 4541]MCP1904315.1 drug/metabolite transporter (DMT)-like permease [Bradyrhizobium sp. USDA 4537]MCP1915153.1 drug/metabolite transporter (DMT)-like permease [Bradyrhizobium elkanii]MCP1990029.1 drug/metabolite transporter (DMT)-like permease [Bradyrhizobium sp. USDA 4539]SDD18533.1 Permease of the drug/metabolite transporter (DMT
MAAAMASFTVNDTITKAVSAELNIGEILLVRGLVAMVLVAALAWYRDALRSFSVLLIWPVGLRVLGEIGGTLTYLSAIAQIPLANASAIFQALPLVITLGAALVFGEPVGWRRWLAIAAGFIGVLVIVRPGAEGFSQAALLALASVGFCAVRDLATRRIPKELPTVFITLLTTVTVTTAGAVVLVPLGGWRPPSGTALGLLILAAVLILIGYQCIIVSLRTGDISAVAPFRYTALPWAMLTGYLAFGHKPDGPMLAGAAIIVASGLYAFYRERKRDKLRPAATGPGLPPDGL